MRRGLTLIDVLIALAIAGVLSAVALPSFGAAQAKARRSEARLELARMAAWMELRREQLGLYPSEAAERIVGDGRYRLVIEAVRGSDGFTLAAWPQGAQAQDACGVLRLNERGETDLAPGQARVDPGRPRLCRLPA